MLTYTISPNQLSLDPKETILIWYFECVIGKYRVNKREKCEKERKNKSERESKLK